MAYQRKTKIGPRAVRSDSGQTRGPKSHSVRDAVRAAQAETCARAICLGLGIPESLLPAPMSLAPLWDAKAAIRKPVTLVVSDRFRRTRQEIAESKALEEFQLARRAGTATNFVIESTI
jgi:hypothetical protein